REVNPCVRAALVRDRRADHRRHEARPGGASRDEATAREWMLNGAIDQSHLVSSRGPAGDNGRRGDPSGCRGASNDADETTQAPAARLTFGLHFPDQTPTLCFQAVPKPSWRLRIQRTEDLRYLFEEYAFDTDRRELHRGDAVVALAPQVFDLLFY